MKKIIACFLGVMAIVLSSCGSSIDAIELGDSGAQRTSPVANDSAAGSTEKMWAPYQNMIYTVEGEIPELGGSGQAYEVVPKKVSTDKIMLLAQSFGLNDKVVLGQDSNKDNPSYTVGSADGSAPGLYVYGDASLSYWSYNNISSASRTACAVAPSAPDSSADTVVVDPVCGMPEAPTNLPTKDQAIGATQDLLINGGLSGENLRFDVYADDWGVSVNAIEQLEGLEVPLSHNVTFGQDSKVSYANGVFVTLKKSQKYPLISTTDGVKRLQDSVLTSGCTVCRGAVESPLLETTTNDVISPSGVPDVVVKITGVKNSLLLIWTAKGVPVLLPAYTYSNSDGDVGQVIAVQDKYIKKQGVESPSDSIPASGIGTVPVDQVPPVSISAPAPSAEVTQQQAATLVGLTEDEATKMAQEKGWTIRVAARDGEQFMLTADYSLSRVNITVVASLVTEVTVG